MLTKEVIDSFRARKGLPLEFIFENGSPLATGHHITEVKNVRIDSVDCGGAPDQWNETLIQLWVPSLKSEQRMT